MLLHVPVYLAFVPYVVTCAFVVLTISLAHLALSSLSWAVRTTYGNWYSTPLNHLKDPKRSVLFSDICILLGECPHTFLGGSILGKHYLHIIMNYSDVNSNTLAFCESISAAGQKSLATPNTRLQVHMRYYHPVLSISLHLVGVQRYD